MGLNSNLVEEVYISVIYWLATACKVAQLQAHKELQTSVHVATYTTINFLIQLVHDFTHFNYTYILIAS